MGMPSSNNKVFAQPTDHANQATIASPFFKSRYWEYLIAYKAAGDWIVDRAIQEASLLSSVSVYPLSFLYRQFLELYIKHLLMRFSAPYRENEGLNGSHDLYKLWECLYELTEANIHDFEEEVDGQPIYEILNAADGYIKELSAFDYNSFSFRYPDNKEHTQIYLTEERNVDLANMRERINELANLLCYIQEGFVNYEILK